MNETAIDYNGIYRKRPNERFSYSPILDISPVNPSNFPVLLKSLFNNGCFVSSFIIFKHINLFRCNLLSSQSSVFCFLILMFIGAHILYRWLVQFCTMMMLRLSETGKTKIILKKTWILLSKKHVYYNIFIDISYQ